MPVNACEVTSSLSDINVKKTAVYTLVNGVITHQKQQISKKWYYAAWHCL